MEMRGQLHAGHLSVRRRDPRRRWTTRDKIVPRACSEHGDTIMADLQAPTPAKDARRALVLQDRPLVANLIELTLNHGLFVVRDGPRHR